MKNHFKIIVSFSIFILLAACSSTNKMTMGATNPAKVFLSSEITRVGIINRSAPSKGNNALDKIDQILSAEGIYLDKKGAESAVSSFVSELGMIKNLESITIIDSLEEVKSGLAVLPASLSWNVIENICKENDVDVLFSLAFFDTDTKSTYKVTTMPLKNNLGVEVDVPAQEVTLNTFVTCGWRMYDPQSKLIIDEYVYNKNMAFTGKGINPLKAVEAVKRRNETVLEYSKNVGIAYATRYIPNNVRISREYYITGSDNFKTAQRRALAGDWSGAAELWKIELNNSDAKILGRAYYNMAISSEINGNLEQAIVYATTAYTDYKNKLALEYISLLKYRQQQNQILADQLSSK